MSKQNLTVWVLAAVLEMEQHANRFMHRMLGFAAIAEFQVVPQ